MPREGHKHDAVRKELHKIAATQMRPGDALPGERQLEERFGVSRITIRRAITDLVNEGVLVREHGRGTFVSHGKVQSQLHLASFHEDMRRAGLEPSTRVIAARLEEPPAEAVRFLGAGPGERMCLLKRLRLANGSPVSVDECWLPPRLVPGLLDGDLTASLYGHLADAGVPVLRADQTVGAEAADDDEASHLGIEPGAPVLVFRRYSYTDVRGTETPIEYSISTYRADRYQLSMRVE